MRKNILSIKKEILIHLIFWIIWIYYYRIGIDANGPVFLKMDLFSYTWSFVYISTFYFNYFIVLPKIFTSFKWRKLLLGIFIVFLFFSCLRYFIEQFLTVLLFNVQNYYPGTTVVYYLYDNLFFGSKPIIMSCLLWLVIFIIRFSEESKAILEENKNSEIKFLKSQINPHFVFNTLNNIYSLVYFKSDKSLSAIEKLSQIMQFTTYESQKEKINLSDEVKYIQAYIELEQLRNQEDAFVNLNIEIENENIEIPPFILSPLVENALKHGIVSNVKPILVELKADNMKLYMKVQNEISSLKKDRLGGIGLDNLKKRLKIYYPEQHLLIIIKENNSFIVELEINLR